MCALIISLCYTIKKTLLKISYPQFDDKNNIYKRAISYLSKSVNQYKN